jgi:hypothetical protein
MFPFLGNRSSVDEGMAQGAEDETTVVEPEQGNGMLSLQDDIFEEGSLLMGYWNSSLAYYFAVATRCRLESCGASDVYSGAEEYVGEDYEVRQGILGGMERLRLMVYSFMAHPETLLPMPTIDDPVERFVSVVKFYLSGWHIKPP